MSLSDIGAWWSDLSAAALVGTARRPVPALPAELGVSPPPASREVALLDATALGSVLRRAGAVAGSSTTAGDVADADRRTPAPRRATELLELLLRQSPVGGTLGKELVRVWVDVAAALGHRAPHHLLPELLVMATRHEELRDGVRGAADARGAWLARANPDWRWAVDDGSSVGPDTGPGTTDAAAWARLPTEQRVGEVVLLRSSDPARARELVESTWKSEAAVDRATLLAALRTGMSVADEQFLERALDDRSLKVRAAAVLLLDALPTSARAERMADRLRPLLRHRGLVRKQIEVDLPSEPDEAATRDGLTRSTSVGSVRGWWLQRIAAGAPLDVWTEVAGTDVRSTWRQVTDHDARAGIVEAVLARRDATWAAAVVRDVWSPDLLALLPPELVEQTATAQLAAATSGQVPAITAAVPAPWPPGFSNALLQRLMAEKDAGPLLHQLTHVLATHLHPSTRTALDGWASTLDADGRQRVVLVSQFLSLVTDIPEAFR